MAYVLFISEDKLKDSSAINGNVDVEFLLPYVKISQRKHIETLLGTDLYNACQTHITNGTLTGAYQTLIDDYVADALVHWAFYECIPFLTFKIMNNNIVQKTSENAESLSADERQFLREEVRNTAEWFTERTIDYIRNTLASFPEYATNTLGDIRPEKDAYYSGFNTEAGRLGRRRRINTVTLEDFLDW